MPRRKKTQSQPDEPMWKITFGELSPLDHMLFGSYGGQATNDLIFGTSKFRREGENHWLELNWHTGALVEDSLKYRDSLKEIVEELDSRHVEGSVWYRGQRSRYCAHSPIIVQHGPDDVFVFDLHMDSMLPSGFRSKIPKSNILQWDDELREQFLQSQDLHHIAFLLRRAASNGNGELKEYLANCLREYLKEPWKVLWWQITRGGLLVGNVPAKGAPAVDGKHKSTVPDWLCRCISLAQHYENPSFMTDVTADPEVAGWFANCSWSTGKPVPASDTSSQGVIYRFDMEKFFKGVQENFQFLVDNQPEALGIVGCFGVTDIRDIPGTVARRPGCQKGGSIFGTESFVVMGLMQKFGALEAYVFPHSGENVGQLQHKDLVPSNDDDPANAVIGYGAHYDNSRLTEAEIAQIGTSLGLDADETSRLICLSLPRSEEEIRDRIS